jgi:hypothetical protein
MLTKHKTDPCRSETEKFSANFSCGWRQKLVNEQFSLRKNLLMNERALSIFLTISFISCLFWPSVYTDNCNEISLETIHKYGRAVYYACENYVINEIGRMVALNEFLGDIFSKLALKCWNSHICFRFVVRNERNFIFLWSIRLFKFGALNSF